MPIPTSDSLPGIAGTALFGAPLWEISYIPITLHRHVTIKGSALILDPKVLPHKRHVKITGGAVIQR